MRDAYALDPAACAAGLSFPTAPYLAVQCERSPDHDGMHEARVSVPQSNGAHPNTDSLAGFHSRPHALAWIRWDAPRLEPPADDGTGERS